MKQTFHSRRIMHTNVPGSFDERRKRFETPGRLSVQPDKKQRGRNLRFCVFFSVSSPKVFFFFYGHVSKLQQFCASKT